MSQWDSTALANNCCNKSLVRPSFLTWHRIIILSGQTQRQDSAKATLQELSNRTYRTSPSGPTALTVSFHSLPVPTVRSESKSLRALQRPILILPHQQRSIPSSPSVANPWGHIPAGYVWPSACEEGWNIDSLAHRAWIPWQAWKAITQSPGMHLMLHCLLCIIETKNFGDFCGMASASAVDGNYLELIHDIQARCWLL